jgi:hypothetical protein
MDFAASGIKPEDAQLLGVRLFEVREVARIFNLPPHKLGDLADATFSNVEQQNLDYLVDGIVPRLVVWEQELDYKLGLEEQGLFAEHLVDGILRSDFETRTEGYTKMVRSGLMSRNDVRMKENMNPIDGGDRFFVSADMVALDDDGTPVPPPQLGRAIRSIRKLDGPFSRQTETEWRNTSLNDRWRIQETFRSLIEEALARVVTRERNAISRQMKQMPEMGTMGFSEWLQEFYEEHREFYRSVIGPILLALLAEISTVARREVGLSAEEVTEPLTEFEEEFVGSSAARYSNTQRNQLQKLTREAGSVEEATELIEQRLTEWTESVAPKVSLQESTRATSAVSKMIYAVGGISILRWVANSNACPLCRRMHGRTVEISGRFLERGEVVDPEEEGTEPLVTKQIIDYPPLHRGCVCGVSPG